MVPPPSLQRFVVVATKAGSPACVSDNGGKKGKYMLLKRLSPEKHRTVSHRTRLILATSPDGALLTSLAQPFATVQCDSFSCPVSGGHVKYHGLCFVARLRCCDMICRVCWVEPLIDVSTPLWDHTSSSFFWQRHQQIQYCGAGRGSACG